MLYQIFTQIIHMSVMAVAVIVVVLFLHVVMRRLPAKYLYLMWIIVGIRLVCPYAIPSPVSLFNVVHQDIRSDLTEKTEIKDMNLSPTVLPETELSGDEPESSYTVSSENSIKKELQEPVKEPVDPMVRYGTVIWLIGMILIFLWNIIAAFHMKKKLKRAVRYQKNIYECDNIPSPFVMGILQPKIYIPFRLGEEERTYILEHEQHHIRRGDHLVKFLSFLLTSVYWFHPLVWLSYFLMIQDMEMSCDEYVLQMMPEDIRAGYSRSLLGFAMNKRRMTAGCLTFGETNVRKRVKNVMNFRKPAAWIGVVAVLVLIAAGAICLTNAMGNDSKPKSSMDEKIGKENILEPYEAVLADAQIHGYEVQFVYSPSDKKQTVEDNVLVYKGRAGEFELRTSKDNILCARLPFRGEGTRYDCVYFPMEGFDLKVKDYDGDGNADDFFIGQGQTPEPMMGNCMQYWLFTVEEDGGIKEYDLSGYVTTMPKAIFSEEFEYKDGKIWYQGFGSDGSVEEQTEEITGIARDSSNPELGRVEEVPAVTGQPTTEQEYEAVLARAQIHGYEVRFVYSPQEKEIKKTNGMYEGQFELRTYKDNMFYYSRKIIYKYKHNLYYPEEGFELALKDYDGDGDADEFSIGQAETMIPRDGKSMVYWIFSVDKDGSICQCRMDNDEKDCLKTVPTYNFSREFDCLMGEIYYIGFNDKGEKEGKTTKVIGRISDVVKTLE